MKLTYICAQPANLYFAWQVEVLLNNFIEVDIDLNNVHIVCSIKNEIPIEWEMLVNNYSANFFFYEDTRVEFKYISSIRPHILKKHFEANPYLKNEVIFYHDSDILFTKLPSEWITDEMLLDDNWYGSNTISYIGYDYIKSKGDDVLDLMCEVIDIPKEVIEKNKNNSIGAQYILKNISSEFWNQVEIDCDSLYKKIKDLNNNKVIEDRRTISLEESRIPYHPIQIWCADMWALLWNGWKLKNNTIVHPNFNFSWPTDSINSFHTMNIYHNSGVVDSNKNYSFYKQLFTNRLPYEYVLTKPDKTLASWEYYNFIKKVGKNSVIDTK
jgi:hypothetical protein